MANQELLVHTLVELADHMVEDFDVVDLLSLLTERCCEAFDVDDAGLMLAAPVGGDLRAMASSSTVMRDLEMYELQATEGPCLDCYRTGQLVTEEDLEAAPDRWPQFSPAALAVGFHSVASIPMRLRGTTIGALNMFRHATGALSEGDLVAARGFADVATIAIVSHRTASDAQVVNDQLTFALNSRVTIEQAKGVLAERANLSLGEAFTWLRHHARSNGIRLVDVCNDFISGAIAVSALQPAASPLQPSTTDRR